MWLGSTWVQRKALLFFPLNAKVFLAPVASASMYFRWILAIFPAACTPNFPEILKFYCNSVPCLCLYYQEVSLLPSQPSPTLEKSVVAWPWLDASHPPEILHSVTLLRKGTGERKHNQRFMNWDKGRERSLTNYCNGHYSLDLGK